jgi:hypothetical protein
MKAKRLKMKAKRLKMKAKRLKMETRRVCRPALADLHHFDEVQDQHPCPDPDKI